MASLFAILNDKMFSLSMTYAPLIGIKSEWSLDEILKFTLFKH